MLAVSISTGDGTKYPYDSGDDGTFTSCVTCSCLTFAAHFYSAILVLGTAGTLKFPEMGLQMVGDMAFFLAAQQLHKLSVDSDDSNARQVVLTLD